MGNQCCAAREDPCDAYRFDNVVTSRSSPSYNDRRVHPVCDDAKGGERNPYLLAEASSSSSALLSSLENEMQSVLKLISGVVSCQHVLIALADNRLGSGSMSSSVGGEIKLGPDDITRHSIGMFRQRSYPWDRLADFICTIQSSESVTCIPDVTQNARLCKNPLVTGGPGIRFFCGLPLLDSQGQGIRVGTLCIVDSIPRTDVCSAVYAILHNLGGMAVRHIEREMELKLKSTKVQELQDAYRRQATSVFSSPTACAILRDCTVWGQGWAVVHANEAWHELTGVTRNEVVGFFLSDIFYALGDSQLPSTAHQAKVEGGTSLNVRAYLKKPASRHFRYSLTVKNTSLDQLGVTMCQLSSVRHMPGAPGHLNPEPSDRFLLMEVRQDEPSRGQHSSYNKGRSFELPRTSFSSADGQPVTRQSSLRVAGVATSHNSRSSHRSLSSVNGGTLSHASFSNVRNGIGGAYAKEIEGLELGRLLGKGGFGCVYLGRWYGTQVAVKVMDGEIQVLKGEAKEGLLGLELRHPYVVSTLQYIVHRVPGTPAMPLCRDPSTTHAGGGGGGGGAIITYDEDEDDGFSLASGDGGEEPEDDLENIDNAVVTAQTLIVMEYCDKGSLHEAVQNGLFHTVARPMAGTHPAEKPPKSYGSGPLLVGPGITMASANMKAIIATAFEVASALRFMHSHGVVHGDLSAWNVMLCMSGASAAIGGRHFVAKISDFGLARCMGLHKKVQTQTFGTLTHMPPETLVDGIVSKGTDVYSFGVILWQMLTRQEPWSGYNKAQIVTRVGCGHDRLVFPPGAPPRYEALAVHCMTRDPEGRPTIDELWPELEALREEYGVPGTAS